MQYSDEILSRVKTYGALGYDIEKIITLVRPDDESAFAEEFKNPSSLLYKAYKSGFAAGQYNRDVAEFEVVKTQQKIARLQLAAEENYYKIRKELFGV